VESGTPVVLIYVSGQGAPSPTQIFESLLDAGIESTADDHVRVRIATMDECHSVGRVLAALVASAGTDLKIRIDGPCADSTLHQTGLPNDDERIAVALAYGICLDYGLLPCATCGRFGGADVRLSVCPLTAASRSDGRAPRVVDGWRSTI
jgi:hypothetical protein